MGTGHPRPSEHPVPRALGQDRRTGSRRSGHWEGELVHTRRTAGRSSSKADGPCSRDRDGKPATILEINRDITARKSVEEALRRSSFYTRGLIEASLDPLVAISPAGKITDVNRATELATGVPRTELIGSDFSDYFTEPAKAREGYEKVFSEGSVRDYPLAIRHVSGRVTEVLYNAVVFKDEAGAPVGVFAAARDVTALKAAEQERLRLAMAIEQIKDGVSILDLEGRILSANPAFASHHGFRQTEVIGRPLHEVLGIDAGEIGDARRHARGRGGREVLDLALLQEHAPGGGRELDLSVSPIRDVSGRLVNLIAVERDVTQEVIFQERIRQWQKMEALGTLAGGIAHDLNNLLLPIMINTELTLDEAQGGRPDRPPAEPGPRSGPARPGHGQADHRLLPAPGAGAPARRDLCPSSGNPWISSGSPCPRTSGSPRGSRPASAMAHRRSRPRSIRSS